MTAQVQALVSASKGTLGTTLSPAYGTATTAGNLLVAGISMGAATAPSIAFPAGWTKRRTITNASGPVITQVWDNVNNAGGITTVAITGLPSGAAVVHLSEWSGILTSSANDVTATANSSSSTQVKTGTSNTLAGTGELGIGYSATYDINNNAITFSAPTNSYSIPTGGTGTHSDNTGGGLSAVFVENINVGTAGTGSTITITGASGTNQYAGVISTYIPAAATAQPYPQASQQFFPLRDDYTEYSGYTAQPIPITYLPPPPLINPPQSQQYFLLRDDYIEYADFSIRIVLPQTFIPLPLPLPTHSQQYFPLRDDFWGYANRRQPAQAAIYVPPLPKGRQPNQQLWWDLPDPGFVSYVTQNYKRGWYPPIGIVLKESDNAAPDGAIVAGSGLPLSSGAVALAATSTSIMGVNTHAVTIAVATKACLMWESQDIAGYTVPAGEWQVNLDYIMPLVGAYWYSTFVCVVNGGTTIATLGSQNSPAVYLGSGMMTINQQTVTCSAYTPNPGDRIYIVLGMGGANGTLGILPDMTILTPMTAGPVSFLYTNVPPTQRYFPLPDLSPDFYIQYRQKPNASWFIPPLPPTRQPSQQWDPLLDLNVQTEIGYAAPLQAAVYVPPLPPTRQPSQQWNPLLDTSIQYWVGYTQPPETIIPPPLAPSRQPSQQLWIPLPDYFVQFANYKQSPFSAWFVPPKRIKPVDPQQWNPLFDYFSEYSNFTTRQPIPASYVSTPPPTRQSSQQLWFPLLDLEPWWEQYRVLPPYFYPLPTTYLMAHEGLCGIANLIIMVGEAGLSRVQNNIEGYDVYLGAGSLPDLTAPPVAFSLTLPISVPLTPPVSGTLTYYILVRKQDTYGLTSQNSYFTTITIDQFGNIVLPPLLAPQNLQLFQLVGGYIRVLATYPTALTDPYPATQWKVWAGLVPPNPAVDTPVVITNVNGKLLVTSFGPNVPGLYYVTVGLYRTTDTSLSPTISGTIIVSSDPDEVLAVPSGWAILP